MRYVFKFGLLRSKAAMGRTFRRRSRKKCLAVNLSSDPNFVRLTRWMSKKGWNQICSLRLAKFVDTGRGLMAMNNVCKGANLLVHTGICR